MRHFRPAAVALLVLLASLARPAASDTSCRPKGLGWWRQQCLAGHEEIRNGLATARSVQTFQDLEGVADACRVLSGSEGRTGARAHYLATLMNLGTGRLAMACCLELEGRTVTLGDVLRRIELALRAANDDECVRLGRVLRDACADARFVTCPARGHGHDDDDHHDHGDGSGHGSGVPDDDTHHHGQGHEHGRGHEQHGQGHGYGHYKERHGDDDHGDDDRDRCCDPRSADSWERACERREEGGAWGRVDDDCRRDFGDRACALLSSDREGGCARARRELVALRLNLASGRVEGGCRLEGGRTAAEAERRATELLRSGDCDEALALARRANSASELTCPAGCAGHGHDDDHEDEDEDDGKSKGSKPKDNPGKGKGKDKR